MLHSDLLDLSLGQDTNVSTSLVAAKNKSIVSLSEDILIGIFAQDCLSIQRLHVDSTINLDLFFFGFVVLAYRVGFFFNIYICFIPDMGTMLSPKITF